MKDLTSSVYSFESLIQGGFLYVDKTEYIWRLIRPAKEMYFLSRPRRFGKSLTISTLKAVFEGKKELFTGLALYDKPYDWKAHPIIHLDMNGRDFSTLEKMEERFRQMLREQAAVNGVTLKAGASDTMFHELIKTLHDKGGDVVLLLDEYDKPILSNISKENRSEFLEALKVFYSVIKEKSGMLRLAFITGVSKFCHVSLFSDLNNLTDITMDARYATMFGYTQREFESNFAEQIAFAEKKQPLSRKDFLEKIRTWYDGYRFEESAEPVYNPVSLAKFFESGGKFNNYWFSTGTPTFLMKLISKQRFDLEEVLSSPVSGFAFDAYEIDKLNPLTLLLQTGYLTIDGAVQRYGDTAYRLHFPNLEVKGSFETYLAGHCSGLLADQVKDSVYKLADAVTAGDVDGFMEAMKVFFAKVPYDVHLKDENNFRLLFFSIFMLLGISITAESKTNEGRIDAVAANEGFVFVFEFKLGKNKETALDQIRNRDYCRRYMNSGKKIFLVGVNFDMERGQIQDWTSQAV